MSIDKSWFTMGWPWNVTALFLVLFGVTFLVGFSGIPNVPYPVTGKLYAGQSGLEGDIEPVPDLDISDLANSNLPTSNENIYPTRLALGLNSEVYVSDAKADAVFIYDADLDLIGKLKGINRPLGVAVAPDGNIYVGSDADDYVQVYDCNGAEVRAIGVGTIKMPNDLAIDRDGWLYVVDSLSNKVWIYTPDGFEAGSAGTEGDNPGQLDFPVAVTIAYHIENDIEVGELYVADQRHALIQVFDLQGNFLRAYGGKASPGEASKNWQGKFAKIQSLAIDTQGRIHTVDTVKNKIQILDAETGAYIDSYGEFGTAEGQLNLPLDILIVGSKVIVANAENKRVEVIYTIP